VEVEGPAHFGSYRTPWGRGGASVSTVRVTYALPASEALTSVKDYSSSSPITFLDGRVVDVQSPNRRPPTTVFSLTRGSQRPLFWAITIGCPKNGNRRCHRSGA